MSESEDTHQKRQAVSSTQRLHDFLTKLRAYNLQSAAPFIEVQRQVLGIDTKEGATSDFRTVSTVWTMLEAANQEIHAYLPESAAFYSRAISPLTDALGIRNANLPWNQHSAWIRDGDVRDIEGSAFRLKELVPERELFENEIGTLLVDLEELFVEIEKSDLPSSARGRLRGKFELLKSGLLDYRLTGVPGIHAAVDGIVGLVTFDPVLSEELQAAKHPKRKALLKLVAKVILGALQLLSAANTVHDGYKNLAEPLSHWVTEAPALADPQPPAIRKGHDGLHSPQIEERSA